MKMYGLSEVPKEYQVIERKEGTDDASGIFCNVNDFYRLCIFSDEQISKAYFGVLYSYDNRSCHRKSGLCANSRSKDGGGSFAGESSVMPGISFFAAVHNPSHCGFV